MATLQDYRDERLRKLEELKKLGINPYPAKANRTHGAGDVTARFDELSGQTVTVAGRIMGLRKFGKLAFIVLKDFSGQVQLFLRDGDVQELSASEGILGIKELPLLDTGDFIEATGEVIKTKTGEISVGVKTLRLLTKSLRPMPTELTNKEERLRRRYVDMNVNQNVRDRFVRRSKFWQSTREFLDKSGFIEINIPVLEHTTGGADANPFVTHMDALDQDFYLRISHELPLKRLLGAGFEKVYDLGPRFRNENYSDEHLPEHTAMEWYWAYADWEDGMKFTQEMIRRVADATWGTRQFTLMNGQQIDLGKDGEDWPRLSFVQLIKERYGLDVFDCTLEQAVAELKKIGGEVEKIDNRSRVIDKLWKKIRVELPGPAFLTDIPTFLQPLAKLQPNDTRLTQQFNLILGGTEACKAYSELNDPIDQLNRFVEQQQMRDAGDDEAMMLDIDFVEMLEYGMPPACGYGHSERLFWMLEGVTAREGVVFPQLRSEIDATTKELYPQVSWKQVEAQNHPDQD
jgi:lysyl-tRNA synthetase, class II